MSDANETKQCQSVKSLGAKAIDRRSTLYESAVAPVVGSIATATEIEYRNFAGGNFRLNSGTLATMSFYAAEKSAGDIEGTGVAGTYSEVYDVDNNAVSVTVTSDKWYPIPDELFGLPWIKFVGDAAGVIDVSLKG